MNRLIIIGAGGHGKVAADIAILSKKYDEIAFLDDLPIPDSFPYLQLGKVSDYVSYIENSVFFIAIGNNSVRKKLLNKLIGDNATVVSLFHPTSVISRDVSIGTGTIIMAGTVINTGTTIGNGVIINTCSSVDHDCIIEDFVHVSVGSHVAGTVSIGPSSFIGAGATIINNIKICPNSIIGAGAVVIKNILIPGTYIGVPAVKTNF